MAGPGYHPCDMRQADVPTPATGPGFPPEDVVAGLLHAATLAPSMHNTQPWGFRVRRASQEIELYADPARMLGYGEPRGRAVHLACGAALMNLRIAVVMAERQPLVTLLPDRGQPLLLATLRLAGRCRPTEAERELHAAIAARHTNRRPFSNRPVPPGVLAELVTAARLEGAVLHLPGQEETHRLLRLVADAERDLLADPGYRAELATATATPLGWLRAGQALQRVLLTATVHGIAASPLTQPLETADAWLVRDPASASESPQMIL